MKNIYRRKLMFPIKLDSKKASQKPKLSKKAPHKSNKRRKNLMQTIKTLHRIKMIKVKVIHKKKKKTNSRNQKQKQVNHKIKAIQVQ